MSHFFAVLNRIAPFALFLAVIVMASGSSGQFSPIQEESLEQLQERRWQEAQETLARIREQIEFKAEERRATIGNESWANVRIIPAEPAATASIPTDPYKRVAAPLKDYALPTYCFGVGADETKVKASLLSLGASEETAARNASKIAEVLRSKGGRAAIIGSFVAGTAYITLADKDVAAGWSNEAKAGAAIVVGVLAAVLYYRSKIFKASA